MKVLQVLNIHGIENKKDKQISCVHVRLFLTLNFFTFFHINSNKYSYILFCSINIKAQNTSVEKYVNTQRTNKTSLHLVFGL